MNWIHFGLGIVLMALQGSIKNPQSLANERKILEEIYGLLGAILPQLRGQ